MKPLLYVLVGAVAATTLILACSDDSPGDADAAVCDCPAAEPPVPARIMTTRGIDGVVPANNDGAATAACPSGAKFMSGSCFVDDPATNDMQLTEFGKADGQEAFACFWLSHHAAPQTVHAEVTCLIP